MNESQRNAVIARNETLDPPEFSHHADSCDCSNCEDSRPDRCKDCRKGLKSHEIDYCMFCLEVMEPLKYGS